MLASHSENITHVAAIISERCYEDAILGGYTGRHRDHFVEVAATVDGKPFSQRAWLYVPRPSGPLHDGCPSTAQEAVGDAGRVPESDGTHQSTDADLRPVSSSAPNGNVNTGTVHGGQSVGNYHIAGDHVEDSKAACLRGWQGDRIRGSKYQGRQ